MTLPSSWNLEQPADWSYRKPSKVTTRGTYSSVDDQGGAAGVSPSSKIDKFVSEGEASANPSSEWESNLILHLVCGGVGRFCMREKGQLKTTPEGGCRSTGSYDESTNNQKSF